MLGPEPVTAFPLQVAGDRLYKSLLFCELYRGGAVKRIFNLKQIFAALSLLVLYSWSSPVLAQTTVDLSSMPATATVGVAYSGTIKINYGGKGPSQYPWTYSLASGTAPPGLPALPQTAGATGTSCAPSSVCSPFTWTGTPTQAGTYDFAVNITDSNGKAVNSTPIAITIVVAAAGGGGGASAPTATVAQAAVSGTAGTALTAVTPVTGAGGTGTLTYSISPAIAAGLSFSTSTGQLTGTPSAAQAATSYTVTVTDTAGKTASASFTLTVAAASGGGASAPTATVAQAAVSGTAGTALTAVTPVTGAGGTGTLTYSISPAIAAGLSFSTSTGQLTGTPSAAQAATSYTVTVTDTAGKTATASFTLTVAAAAASAPTATVAQAAVVGTAGTALTAVTPVTGAGGTGALTYSISPAIAAGLSFGTSNGQLSGTPSATQAASSYTVTVTDTAGKTATASFTLTVVAAPVVNPVSRPDPSKDLAVRGLLTAQGQMAQQFARSQLSNVSSRAHQLGSNGDSQSGFWAGGETQNASMDLVHKLSSNSLTLGLDGRLQEKLVGGIAAGFADDSAQIDNSGNRVDGTSYSFVAYGAYSLPTLRLNASLGYGTSSLDSRRWVAVDGAFVSGSRQARSTFGSVELSKQAHAGGWVLEPSVGAEFINSALRGFSETDKSKATNLSLTYNDSSVRSLAWLVGAQATYDVHLSTGLLTPVVKAVYRQISDQSQSQSLFYSDAPSTVYTTAGSGLPESLLSAEAGVQFANRSGLNTRVVLGYASGGNGYSGTAIKATFNKAIGR